MPIRIRYMIACLMMVLQLQAQQNDESSFAGAGAVFVYNIWPPASARYPDASGNTGFQLQRRERGAAWVTVADMHSPETAGELMDRYTAAQRLFPGYTLHFDAAAAWQKWQRYKTYDSLINEVGFPPGQMAFGILVADTTVQQGKAYQYRIVKANERVTDDQYAGNWVSYPAQLHMPAPRLVKRQTERDAVILEWAVKGMPAIGWFQVYRAEGNDKAFRQILPFTGLQQRGDSVIYVMEDTKVAFSEMYRYYIMPVNIFGGGGNIISDTVAATCMDPAGLLTPQYIHTREDLAKKAIRLHYLLPDPSYIGTVHIMRSTSFDEGYEEIGLASPADTVFTDFRIAQGKKYYYYLQMTDKMGRNSARSIKTFGLCQDTSNAFPARFVTAVRVNRGIEVSWQNPPDTAVVSGYYVCRSTGGDSPFERITALLPLQGGVNRYVDTSQLLQSSVLYAYSVVSENTSNKVSANSVVAYAAPAAMPELATLPAPKNVKVLAENNRVRLLWYDMRLLHASLATYNIYRKADGDTGFVLVGGNYPASFTSYIDSTVQPGTGYVYAIEGVDAAGVASVQTITARLYTTAIPLAAPVLSAFLVNGNVVLGWEAVTDERVSRYHIYRYTRGGNPEKIGEAAAAAARFEDKKISKGTTYYYYIQADAGSRTVPVTASNKAYVVTAE